jgi:hypothetical protein
MAKTKNRKADRKKKGGKKTSQLAIRVEKAERDAFVELCETLDTSAAREIRRFMRDFVASHSKPAQPASGDDTPAVPQEAVPAAAVEVTVVPAKPKRTTAARKPAAPKVDGGAAKTPATGTKPSPGEAPAAPVRSRRTAKAKPSE